VKLNHRQGRCTFEAILEDYTLTDPALQRLALIVRGADVKGQEHVSPESFGLQAIARGFAATGISDEERLSHEFPVCMTLCTSTFGSNCSKPGHRDFLDLSAQSDRSQQCLNPSE
jgi:hypothetical protein